MAFYDPLQNNQNQRRLVEENRKKMFGDTNLVTPVDNLMKGYINTLEKGKGEGSKGGKVIGHTKSGKAIYERPDHTSHEKFNTFDHEDAYNLHRKIMNDPSKKGDKHHQDYHFYAGNVHANDAGGKRHDVLGHTESGKPIFNKHDHPDHKDFSKQDHMDAFEKHRSKRNEEQSRIVGYHGEDKKAVVRDMNNSEKIEHHDTEMQKHLTSYGKK